MSKLKDNPALYLLALPFILGMTAMDSWGPLFTLFLVTLSLLLFFIAITKTDFALVILIFSMLLSPEFVLGGIPGRSVVVRFDDILIFVVFFGWLAKMAMNKELGLLITTPLNKPILGYISICLLSSGLGILQGEINPKANFFYILKYVEYFILFFMVSNNIRSKKQIKFFMVAFLITCFLVCAYALLTTGGGGRATAPFEGPNGEPNTLGGYLTLLFALTAGFFLYSPSLIWSYTSAGLGCLIFFTLLQTLSRGSYMAFIVMFLSLTVLTRKKKTLLIGLLSLGILFTPFILPKITPRVTQRLEYTFSRGRTYQPLGRKVKIEDSAAARVESWKRVIKDTMRRPLLGYGVTGVGLVDAQYPRVLGETGIIGFLIFIWLIIVILKNNLRIFNNIEDKWLQGLSLGFLAGFIGLLAQALVANTFIIVRIMEPFWFLAAIVIVLPQIQKQESESLE